MASMIPYQQQTGRKRGYGEFQYPRHAPPQYRSALANIPTGAAIFENSICNRAGLGKYVTLLNSGRCTAGVLICSMLNIYRSKL